MGYSTRYGYTERPMERRKPGLNRFVTGATVTIGFVRDLTVLGGAVIDGRKAVLLESAAGVRYIFTPHLGLERTDRRSTVHHILE